MKQRTPRKKDDGHLGRLRKLPCVYCGDDSATTDRDAAHLRMSRYEIGKEEAGTGQKPHDMWALPLCRPCHDLQHRIGEPTFWVGCNPFELALLLYINSNDPQECERVIFAFHQHEKPANILAAG